jgi:hypothetical protein
MVVHDYALDGCPGLWGEPIPPTTHPRAPPSTIVNNPATITVALIVLSTVLSIVDGPAHCIVDSGPSQRDIRHTPKPPIGNGLPIMRMRTILTGNGQRFGGATATPAGPDGAPGAPLRATNLLIIDPSDIFCPFPNPGQCPGKPRTDPRTIKGPAPCTVRVPFHGYEPPQPYTVLRK